MCSARKRSELVTAPTSVEQQMLARGYRRLAGVDEVGRGCWAGPVVAAAVVLPPDILHNPVMLAGVTDSKQLSPRQREDHTEVICRVALAVGVGSTPAWMIDQLGIIAATQLAMEQAVLSLACCIPDALLLDAVRLPTLPQPQVSMIRGDAASLSIAAASIVAKTTRDRYMRGWDRWYPHGFGQHKGYGTTAHRAALQRYGLTPLHRRSFRPVEHYDLRRIL